MNSSASNTRFGVSLEELARYGCPVDLSVGDPQPDDEKVEIEQVGGIFESKVFQLPDRRVACMAWIAVTHQRARTLDLIDVELRAPWDQRLFQWLQPIEVRYGVHAKRRQLAYRFPGDRHEFPYEEVLNPQLLERKKLLGKRRLEGWLLAIGGFMPDEVVHGQWHDVALAIIGADRVDYCTHLHLPTERMSQAKEGVRQRTSIFGRKEIEEDSLSVSKHEPALVADRGSLVRLQHKKWLANNDMQ